MATVAEPKAAAEAAAGKKDETTSKNDDEKKEDSTETPKEDSTEKASEKPSEKKEDAKMEDKDEKKEADEEMNVVKDEEKESEEKKEEKKEGEEEKEEEPPKDEAEVVKSVAERLKFFFSDANVRQDMFLRKYLMPFEPEENKDCSVPIETLLRFNTIKQHTTDPEVVVKAVKEHLSEKLLLKDDDKAIARVKPFTKDLINENIPLSLYVTNLPVKEQEAKSGKKFVAYDVTMDDIRKLFETYGEVAIVKMRFKRSARSDDDHHTDDIKMEENPPKDGGGRKPRRRFPLKCCMVEFENLEAHAKAAEDVLTKKGGEKVEPKRKLQIGQKTLEVMLLKDYVDGLRKRKREDDDNKDNNNDNNNDEASKFTIDWKPGCVVSMKGLPETCDRESIRDAVGKACELTQDELKEKDIYADYSRGQKDGAIRFNVPELATKMVEKLKSGDIKICDTKIEDVSIIEGDDEKKYWDDFIQFKRKQIRHRNEERKHKHNHRDKRRRGTPKKYETMQS